MVVQIPTGFVLIQSSSNPTHRIIHLFIKEIRKDFINNSSFLIPNS